MADDLLDRVALRVRYRAAITMLEQVRDADERVGLLAEVVAPHPRFEAASRQHAQQLLLSRRRHAHR